MLKKITLSVFAIILTGWVLAQSPFNLCEPSTDFGTTDGDYIASIDFEGENHYTGFSGSDFLIFAEEAFNMEVGTTNYIEITNSADIAGENVKIWVDLNGDETFDPDTELMSSYSYNNYSEVVSLAVNIPADAVPGVVACRIIMHYIDLEDGPCDFLTYGQIIDFPLSINSNPLLYCYTDYSSVGLDGDYIATIDGNVIYFIGGIFSPGYYLSADYESYTPGATMTLDCVSGTYGNDNFLLFVDEDQNGFTISDLKDSFDGTNPSESFQLTYTLPNSLAGGVYRARVVTRYGSNQEPCAQGVGFGHTVDFGMICTVVDASPYCNPTALNGTGDGDFMAVVEITDSPVYSSQAGPGPYYTNYVTQGMYPYYALSGKSGSAMIISGTYNGSDNYKFWIDYNQNNVFDSGELIASGASTGAGQTVNMAWTNPAYTNQGPTRMRAMCHFTDGISDPCDLDSYGEVEDYPVVLVKSNDIYCDPYFNTGNSDGDYINSFSLNEVVLPAIGVQGNTFYKDYTWQTAQVLVGGTYTINVQAGDYSTDTYKIWVDWNNDGTFDDMTEAVGAEITTTNAFENMVFTLNVPGNVTLGNKRLRLVCADAEGLIPCQEDNYGEYLEITVAVVTEISVEESDVRIDIYPNPNHGSMNIQFNDHGVHQVMVFDQLGQLVDSFNASGIHNLQHQYAPGIYTLRVQEGTKLITRTFIVE